MTTHRLRARDLGIALRGTPGIYNAIKVVLSILIVIVAIVVTIIVLSARKKRRMAAAAVLPAEAKDESTAEARKKE